MKKKRTKRYIIRWIICLLLIIGSGELSGSKVSSAEQLPSSSFICTPLFPDNQQEQRVSYFDLRMSPSQKQTVSIRVTNLSDSAIELECSVHNATTNSQGQVDYAKSRDTDNVFREAVSLPKKVSIKARGTKDIGINIHMPKESFDGVVTGGILITDVSSEKEQSTEYQINNQYAYLTSLLLTMNDKIVKPIIEIDQPKYFQDENVLLLRCRNSTPTYIEKLSVAVEKISGDGHQSIVRQPKDNLRMAPNSEMNLPIQLDQEALSAGENTLSITYKSGKNTWTSEETIKVEKTKEANKDKEQNIETQAPRQSSNKTVIIMIGLLILLSVTLIILIKKNKLKR